jgi:hypothetical protein
MEKSFEELKNQFTTALMLTHVEPTKTCIVETDASDVTQGAILSQKADEGRLHPIAFYSWKLQHPEIN